MHNYVVMWLNILSLFVVLFFFIRKAKKNSKSTKTFDSWTHYYNSVATRWQCYTTATKSPGFSLTNGCGQHISVNLWSAVVSWRLKSASVGRALIFWACSDIPSWLAASWLVCSDDRGSSSSDWWLFPVHVSESFGGFNNHHFGYASAPESFPARPASSSTTYWKKQNF